MHIIQKHRGKQQEKNIQSIASGEGWGSGRKGTDFILLHTISMYG